MSDYRIRIVGNGFSFTVPILPNSLQVQSAGDNKTARVLELGEVLMLRKKRLREIGWSSYLPASRVGAPVGIPHLPPMTIIKKLQAIRDEREPVTLELKGFALDVNGQMGIDDLQWEERFGELGDIYYSIKLRDWVDYAPKTITLVEPEGEEEAGAEAEEVPAPVVEISEPERAGTPEHTAAHTVVAGDSLWAIAQKLLGDGSRYPELYSANQGTIDGGNAGTGNSVYTIYPGQVLVIP